jgi:hypothetical protein
MRRPILQAAALAVVAGAGLLAAIHGSDLPEVPGVTAARQPGHIWTLLGLITAGVGAFFCLYAVAVVLTRAGLVAGNDVLARWIVSPEEWAAITGDLMPSTDVLVVIGRDAVVVGESCTMIPAGFNLFTYTRLSSVDWVEGAPGAGGMLVLARMFFSYNQSYINFIRLAVPEAARGKAQAAIDALDPLISDQNRETAERIFPDELAAARGGADSQTWLLAGRLLSWGGGAALFGGAAWWVSTMPARTGEISNAWWMMPAGIATFFVGVVLVLIAFLISR